MLCRIDKEQCVLVVVGMIVSAEEMSMSGQFMRRYSPTSCDSCSYDTVGRSYGRISMFPRRIRILPSGFQQLRHLK